jgi:uncharacterized protein with HEPN domain
MLDYSRKATNMVVGRTREVLDSDEVLSLALTRAVEIVGEAAARVSGDTQRQYKEIPWAEIVGLRNRLVHGYDAVDPNILWDIVQHDLPELISLLQDALAEDDRDT